VINGTIYTIIFHGLRRYCAIASRRYLIKASTIQLTFDLTVFPYLHRFAISEQFDRIEIYGMEWIANLLENDLK
jgi:hypothetical protein